MQLLCHTCLKHTKESLSPTETCQKQRDMEQIRECIHIENIAYYVFPSISNMANMIKKSNSRSSGEIDTHWCLKSINSGFARAIFPFLEILDVFKPSFNAQK